jgi:hypothetical protein
MDEDAILSTGEDINNESGSMEDTLRKTLEEIESRGTENRDDNGRFTPKEKPEEPKTPETPKAEDNQDHEVKQDEPAEVQAAIPTELQRLGLRKEAAQAIAKDPVVMQEFIRRSDEMHRGLEQYREKAQFGDSINRAIAPYMRTIQAAGVTPDVAIQALFNADSMLRTGSQDQKIQMLHKLASDYGINIQQVAQTQAQPFDQNSYALQQKLNQLEGWVAQQSQAHQERENATLNSEIERFSNDPANAHFAAVREDMAGLLQAGLASDLRDAYEKAIYANPVVRAQVLAEQQAKAEAERKAVATQKAQAARQASAVNVARRGALPATKPVGSIDDTIRETAKSLGLI